VGCIIFVGNSLQELRSRIITYIDSKYNLSGSIIYSKQIAIVTYTHLISRSTREYQFYTEIGYVKIRGEYMFYIDITSITINPKTFSSPPRGNTRETNSRSIFIQNTSRIYNLSLRPYFIISYRFKCLLEYVPLVIIGISPNIIRTHPQVFWCIRY
jgi:hypothetical protein